MIASAKRRPAGQANPDAATPMWTGFERYGESRRPRFRRQPEDVTEMDALIAYLQMLGTLVDFSIYDATVRRRPGIRAVAQEPQPL
jgi:cytochrome c oxidase cbb3-type subunit 2